MYNDPSNCVVSLGPPGSVAREPGYPRYADERGNAPGNTLPQ
ncbi:hypothetical protein E2C01_102709 [Portunus trituberculatus]|uniref:Uncharacterized protein n=1 Tax=Portunus trituberculatus TaxID=210409 RepID=A0A5B7KN77_PORTR|nr:hypothetical protein [Portunus trituberculatus]